MKEIMLNMFYIVTTMFLTYIAILFGIGLIKLITKMVLGNGNNNKESEKEEK